MKKRITKKIMAVMLVLALLVSLGACTGQNSDENVQSEQSVNQNGTEQNLADDEVDKSVYMDATQGVETRVEALLAQMTLEEKVAQMLQPEQAYITTDEVAEYGVGSVLSGGGSAPSTGNTVIDWAYRVNELKEAALETRLGIPLLYGVDAVHGNNNVYATTIFPHNVGLGATGDLELVEKIGEITAKEVRAIGVQWTFAPSLGNPQNIRWGRSYECFSEDADVVAEFGAAYIRGFQGELGSDEFLDENHVLACAKHYIGEGYTVDGENQGNVAMTEEEFDFLLESGVLDPYTMAINEGVRTVMASYNSVDGLKCHENQNLIRDVLKGELGFTGLVVSDYNAITQLSGVTYKEQIRQAIDAGIDLFMEVSTWKDVYNNILKLVEEGSVSEERIDDSVRRILRVKFEAGLFEEEIGGENELALRDEVGSDEHREVAREAVRKSLVLLKNDMVGEQTALEALQDASNIRLCGQKAYDMGSQCGGWTISWQGLAGMTTVGTTIIDGIAEAVMPEKKLSHDVKGEVAAENEAIIVVVGEGPYAEMYGDRSEDQVVISATDREMLDNLRQSLADAGKEDIPVIAILIGGRCLDITDYMDMFDGIIMAWLPGTEGAGIADVLFGDYDFTGKLTYTWHEVAGDPESPVLFEKGYGLSK